MKKKTIFLQLVHYLWVNNFYNSERPIDIMLNNMETFNTDRVGFYLARSDRPAPDANKAGGMTGGG